MPYMVYRFIWLMLNFIATCYELLKFSFFNLKALYYKSYDLLSRGDQTKLQRDLAFLKRCKSELSKIPSHLCIIIGPEESFSGELLSRIVLYALNLNIDFISFYDTRNAIETEKKGITLKDLNPSKYVCSSQFHENSMRWSVTQPNNKNGTTTNGEISYKNGFITNSMNGSQCGRLKESVKESYIEVVMLKPRDGRELIADTCRELYRQRQTNDIQNLLQNRSMLIDRIDSELKRRLNGMPDPELGIIFHRHTCTFGVMPWQTRFTEFHTIETGQYFNVEMFAKVLYRYSRCEQRWGK